MLEHALLYFIPNQGRDDIATGGEFLDPSTSLRCAQDGIKKGDGLTLDDIAEGYTDYVIWNRFRPECLDIDGDSPMECVDSGMVLLKGDPGRHTASMVRMHHHLQKKGPAWSFRSISAFQQNSKI